MGFVAGVLGLLPFFGKGNKVLDMSFKMIHGVFTTWTVQSLHCIFWVISPALHCFPLVVELLIGFVQIILELLGGLHVFGHLAVIQAHVWSGESVHWAFQWETHASESVSLSWVLGGLGDLLLSLGCS